MVSTLTVLTIGVVSTLFICLSIYFRRLAPEKNRLKNVLSVVLFFNGLFLLKDILYNLYFIEEGGFLYKSLLTIDNWMVAMDIAYVFELLNPGCLRPKSVLYMISPFIACTLLYMLTNSETVYVWIGNVTLLYNFICFIVVIYGVIRYRKASRNLYSDLQTVDIKWLMLAILCLFLLFFLWQVLYQSFNDKYDIYYYILMVLVFGTICYRTEKLGIPSEKEFHDVVGIAASVPVEDNIRHYTRFASELARLESIGYFYTHPQLTLTELAAELRTNRTTLSQYINNVVDKTYYDFVNDIKLKEAVRLLTDPGLNLTQEDVAERAGFNSMSTFRRAFVKKYEMSPIDYRRSFLKK